jgi:hypothetical protein
MRTGCATGPPANRSSTGRGGGLHLRPVDAPAADRYVAAVRIRVVHRDALLAHAPGELDRIVLPAQARRRAGTVATAGRRAAAAIGRGDTLVAAARIGAPGRCQNQVSASDALSARTFMITPCGCGRRPPVGRQEANPTPCCASVSMSVNGAAIDAGAGEPTRTGQHTCSVALGELIGAGLYKRCTATRAELTAHDIGGDHRCSNCRAMGQRRFSCRRNRPPTWTRWFRRRCP